MEPPGESPGKDIRPAASEPGKLDLVPFRRLPYTGYAAVEGSTMSHHSAVLLTAVCLALAPAAHGQAPARSQDTVLFVLSNRVDGDFLLNGRIVPPAELRETLRRTFVGRPIRRLQLDIRVPVDTAIQTALIRAATDFKIELIALPMRPQ